MPLLLEWLSESPPTYTTDSLFFWKEIEVETLVHYIPAFVRAFPRRPGGYVAVVGM